MGVLNDYFRAADAAAVTRLMALADGDPITGAGNGPAVDAVDAKGVEPIVVLSRLVAFALGVPWDSGLVETTLVWPAEADADEEYEGPWALALDDRTRDALAGVPESRIPELAARWVRTEELAMCGNLPPDAMVPVLTEMVALARRAREAQDHLYCLVSL